MTNGKYFEYKFTIEAFLMVIEEREETPRTTVQRDIAAHWLKKLEEGEATEDQMDAVLDLLRKTPPPVELTFEEYLKRKHEN